MSGERSTWPAKVMRKGTSPVYRVFADGGGLSERNKLPNSEMSKLVACSRVTSPDGCQKLERGVEVHRSSFKACNCCSLTSRTLPIVGNELSDKRKCSVN